VSGTRASRPTEARSRLALAGSAGVLLVVWGFASRLLPALPDSLNVMISSAISLTLMGAIVWGLVPLAALGRRLLLIVAVALPLAMLLVWLGAVPFANLAKIVAAAAFGLWIAAEIERVSWIIVVAVVSAVTDIVSVAIGPTRKILDDGPLLIGYFAVIMTWFGYAWSEAHSAIGMSDVIFFALYLGAARSFGLRERLSAVVMIASFLVTLAVAMWWTALPALPLLSLSFLAVNADLMWRGARPGANARVAGIPPSSEQPQS
jgi:hypothetical protein